MATYISYLRRKVDRLGQRLIHHGVQPQGFAVVAVATLPLAANAGPARAQYHLPFIEPSELVTGVVTWTPVEPLPR